MLVDYASVVNPVTISGEKVNFVNQADHVGVTRCSSGNLLNIEHRITAHKKCLALIASAGLARGHRSNIAAALRVHRLYALPVLFSGIASLVLNKKELSILDKHYKETIQNIQKLHSATSRSVVFLLAGTLPAEAVLHCRQLGLLSMICRLKDNPLNHHAKYALTHYSKSSQSWFIAIHNLCLQYRLPHPLTLLDQPPKKGVFKKEARLRITDYWQSIFRFEARSLKSLAYLNPYVHSLSAPSQIWLSASSSPFETAKAVVVARIISGRYLCENLRAHWLNDKGYCQASSCGDVVGDIGHILIHCPALDAMRDKMYILWKTKTENCLPELYDILLRVKTFSPSYLVHFLVYPCAFPEMILLRQTYGYKIIEHVNYLAWTYIFNLHNERQKMIEDQKKITHL